MTEFITKHLVSDADVAISASGDEKPKNSARIFLETILLETNHKAVMTKEMFREWSREGKEKKPSIFFVTWLTRMAQDGDLGRIYKIDDSPTYGHIWEKIEESYTINQGIKRMLEDFHLIRAALETDKIVISQERQVRELFKKASEQAQELQDIVWINPDKPEEDSINWLKDGANLETERLLGFRN